MGDTRECHRAMGLLPVPCLPTPHPCRCRTRTRQAPLLATSHRRSSTSWRKIRSTRLSMSSFFRSAAPSVYCVHLGLRFSSSTSMFRVPPISVSGLLLDAWLDVDVCVFSLASRVFLVLVFWCAVCLLSCCLPCCLPGAWSH